MADLNKIKKFSDYDSTRKPSTNYKAEELKRVLENMNRENELREQTKRDRVLKERINRLIPLIKLAEETVNFRIRQLNTTEKVKISEFKLATTLSVSSIKNTPKGLMTKFNYNVNVNNGMKMSAVNMNIDINRFLSKSAFDAYTTMTETLYKSVVGKDIVKYHNIRGKSPHELKRELSYENTNDIKFRFVYSLAKYKLEKHVEKLLKSLSGNHEIYASSKEIVKDLLRNSLSEQDVYDIGNEKYLLSKLDDDIRFFYTSEKGYDRPLKMEDPDKAVNRTDEAQKWLVTDKEKLFSVYEKVNTKSGKDSRSQLVNDEMSKDEELLNSFNNVKGLFKDGFVNSPRNMENLKTFCTNFTNSYMSAHGLNGIEIRFLNDSSNTAMGEYFDCGDSHYIEVNLARVNSLVELTATLAHELTHAVDSCYHKENGQSNVYGGGILDGTNTNISNSGLVGEAKELLKELNMRCYKADPCEQRARNGEHIGIDFVERFGGSEFAEEVDKYRKTDEKYQAKVDEIKAGLSEYIVEAERKIQSFGLNPNSNGYKMLMEKIEYLKEREYDYQRQKDHNEKIEHAQENEDKLKEQLNIQQTSGNTQELLDAVLEF